jgi:hypothetical protein
VLAAELLGEDVFQALVNLGKFKADDANTHKWGAIIQAAHGFWIFKLGQKQELECRGERHVCREVIEIEFYGALFPNLRPLIREEPFDVSCEVFDATAIEFLKRVLGGASGLQEYIVTPITNIPKIASEAPFQYLDVRLLNSHPFRCETGAFNVEFAAGSTIHDEAVRKVIPIHLTHMADIPVSLMRGKPIQLINKFPALRFLFFLLVHTAPPWRASGRSRRGLESDSGGS